MISTRSTLLALATLTFPLALHAASTDSTAEYEQVRKIAQRDPKVRAAYEAADRKLADKMNEIDPKLKDHPTSQPTPKKAPAAAKPAPAPKVAVKPAAKPMSASAAKKGKERAHVVAKGETLSGIAAQYGVSVATLKEANNITDDRKLMAGHVLVIPGGKASTAAHPAASAKPASKAKPAAAPAKDDSLWGKLKSSF